MTLTQDTERTDTPASGGDPNPDTADSGTAGGEGATSPGEVSVQVRAYVDGLAGAAGEAGEVLAQLTREKKDAALRAMADALVAATATIVAANETDIATGRERGLPDNLLDRLTLDAERVAAVADALRDVAALPDPVGDVVRGSTLPNGLQVRQVRVPMGVVGMIYEARPNVTVDAAGLALKSGNAVLLRGGSAAEHTNAALVEAMRVALTAERLPADAVALIREGGRAAGVALMTARGLVDLVIPRGGADLIRTVVETSTVPVIETGVGNCHVYLDADLDLEQAVAVTVNSATHRTSVCNSAESLLVHRDAAPLVLPVLLADLAEKGVVLHGDADMLRYAAEAGLTAQPIMPEDDDTEFLSLDLSARVVDSLDDAVAHIAAHGSGHTEAIVTTSRAAARAFTARVDAAAVLVNASTRFTDGAQLGFGAEIGISTQKLHARGPMALAELTTTKWIIEGDGHVRA